MTRDNLYAIRCDRQADDGLARFPRAEPLTTRHVEQGDGPVPFVAEYVLAIGREEAHRHGQLAQLVAGGNLPDTQRPGVAPAQKELAIRRKRRVKNVVARPWDAAHQLERRL